MARLAIEPAIFGPAVILARPGQKEPAPASSFRVDREIDGCDQATLSASFRSRVPIKFPLKIIRNRSKIHNSEEKETLRIRPCFCCMAPKKKMTEYERRRLENIRRNDEMMAALKLQSRAAELSATAKRQK